MLKVTIEGQTADLIEATVFVVTYQANDVSDLVTRQANYSNNYVLPFTKNNNDIFDQAKEVNSSSRVPYRKLETTAEQDGLEIIKSGYTVLNSISQNGYHVTTYSGIFDPFSELANINLRELDLSGFDFTSELTEIAALADTSQDVVFPILDYGAAEDGDTKFDVRYSHGAFYVHSLMDFILDKIGYSTSGKVWQSDDYKKAVIPLGVEFFFHSSFRVLTTEQLFSDIDTAGTLIEFTNEFFDPNNEFVTDTHTNVGERSEAYLLKLELTEVSGPIVVSFDSSFEGKSTERIFVPVDGAITVYMKTEVDEFFTGNTMQIRISAALSDVDFNVAAGGELRNLIELPVYEGEDNLIAVAECLPDMTAKELLSSVAQILGMVFDVDPYTREIISKQYKEIIANRTNSLDWSGKLDMDSGITSSFRSGNYAKRNYCSYADDDTLPAEVGRGEFFINDEFLQGTTEIFSLNFAACESSTVLDLQSALVKKYLRNGMIVEKEFDPEPKILAVRDNVGDITYTNGTGNEVLASQKVAYFSDPSQALSLPFMDLLSRNYAQFILLTDAFRVIKCKLNLSLQDIHELDLLRTVYFKEFDRSFLINKIPKFTKGQLSEVELLKVD